MKQVNKMHFPEVHININPINRDLFLVVTIGMLMSLAFITAVVMILSQF